MSYSVSKLISKQNARVEKNLAKFVGEAKRYCPFGDNFDFDSNEWDVTSHLDQKSKRSRTTIVFGAWGAPRPSKNVKTTWMPEPFLSFAKAYVLYEYGLTRKISLNRDMQALRAICHALESHGQADPGMLTSSILNFAANAVKEKYSDDAAHGIGATIQKISGLINEKAIGNALLQWRNPISAPASKGRIGREFEERRQNRLPSSQILVALGKAYQSASDLEDIVYTSMCALMLSSPDRSNEVVSLLVDCESPTQGDGAPGYSLRWWPSKGALPQLKAIPLVMHDLVKDAIARIKRATELGRVIARWYEDQVCSTQPFPKQIYIPKDLEYLRKKELVSRSEISLLLWGEEGHDTYTWCKTKNIPVVHAEGKKVFHRFADVEAAILGELPKHFPYSDNTKRWKCSELLFTMQKFSNTARRPFVCMYVPMDRVDLNYRLDGKNKNSIFAKLGVSEVVGGNYVSIKISSHHFRHYLNQLAHATGELSEVDINLWSGRTSRGEVYNHLSSAEISEKALMVVGDSISTLPAVKTGAYIKMYAREEFARLGVEAGHTTDFGYCVHDFSASPCDKHEDCLDCREQFCIKGDSVREINIRRECEELAYLVAKAEAAASVDTYGADRWLARQKTKLERASELLSIIENPHVSIGTPIRLTAGEHISKFEHERSIALQDRKIRSDVNRTHFLNEDVQPFSLLGDKKVGG